ncbi:hypothetical protein WDW89_18070 [Deltaproteobacteria bacterium TL4]
MADWYSEIVKMLIEMELSNPSLTKEILRAIHLIELNPDRGIWAGNTRRYVSTELFRIGYNFHPSGKIEIVSINIFKSFKGA